MKVLANIEFKEDLKRKPFFKRKIELWFDKDVDFEKELSYQIGSTIARFKELQKRK